MKIRMRFLLLLFCMPILVLGQVVNYEQSSDLSWKLTNVQYLPDTNIDMIITLYGGKKRESDYNAKCSALKILLFDGVGTGLFSKSLLSDGEQTAYNSHPIYFENLFKVAYNDFIKSCVMEGEYKKADKSKGTNYHVIVRALQLRRDLEKKGISNKIGL